MDRIDAFNQLFNTNIESLAEASALEEFVRAINRNVDPVEIENVLRELK